MHITYTLQAKPANFKPDIYAMPTWTTQVAKVPRPTWMEVYNQFEPASKKPSNWQKCLNLQLLTQILPTSTANFEHIFIFSESLLAQNHFGTTGTRIRPVLKEINISPRNWMD